MLPQMNNNLYMIFLRIFKKVYVTENKAKQVKNEMGIFQESFQNSLKRRELRKASWYTSCILQQEGLGLDPSNGKKAYKNFIVKQSTQVNS